MLGAAVRRDGLPRPRLTVDDTVTGDLDRYVHSTIEHTQHRTRGETNNRDNVPI